VQPDRRDARPQGKPRKPSGPWVEWFPEQCEEDRHAAALQDAAAVGDVIIDVEGRELEHGASAALALSTQADAPALITDEHGDTIDTGTGEVVQEAGDGQGVASGDDNATAEQSGDGDQTDDLGVTKDPAEAKAEEVIEAMDKAELLADVTKFYKDVEPHLDFMPAHLGKAIEKAYDRNKARLAPAAKAKAEP
jgi:hypothetical protein